MAGTPLLYVAAVMSLGVNVDTSWEFFGQWVTDVVPVRVSLFAVMEVAAVACSVGVRANVRAGRPAGPLLTALYALAAGTAFMAFTIAPLPGAVGRTILGPVLMLGMLHLALGIEVRVRRGRAGTLARVAGEVRERLLSRLGLDVDPERDAATRTRDRAASRAARLATSRWVIMRGRRVARALRAARVADDPAARRVVVSRVLVSRHASDLGRVDGPSPWDSITWDTDRPGASGGTPGVPVLRSVPRPSMSHGTRGVERDADVVSHRFPDGTPSVRDTAAELGWSKTRAGRAIKHLNERGEGETA